MKSFYYILLLLGMPFWLLAQTTGQNYIVTTVPIAPVSNPTTLTDANSSSNSNSSIQYFDGLGRPVQTVQKAITPSAKDLVNFTEYDAVGREYKHWLPAPATGSTGAYVNPNDFTGLANTQYTSSEKPYATTEFESSPLNRVTGQYGAGTAWYIATKKTGLDYKTNAASEVSYFTVNTSNQLVRGNGTTNYYDANTLYKIVATDEDVKPTTEYKDKQGRVVMKQNSTDVRTYYVNDDFGRLRYVIPPNAVDLLTADGVIEDANSALVKFGYLYQYDGRGNCIYKRLPGCEPIYMVYDKADRLVLSQDGNQRTKSNWTEMYYDAFGRILYSMEVTIDTSYEMLLTVFSTRLNVDNFNTVSPTGTVFNTGYSIYADMSFQYRRPSVPGGPTYGGLTPIGISLVRLLTVNYYDSYSFIPSGNNLSYDGSQEQNGYTAQYSNAKGLLTGTRVYHMDNTSLYETTALYYDKYGRVVQSRATNHLGGYDLVYNAIDFTGKPTRTYKTHGINSASATITELYTYVYNKAQKLQVTTYSLNGASPIALSVNNYDELGRVSAKILGGIDATTYNYNIRSWTTDISGSRFSENLYYNVNPLSSNVCFNGNIAGMQWDVPNEGIGHKRAYSFVYDNLNRLTNANYYGIYNGSVVAGTSDRYNETFTFDKMGNITNFARNGLQSNNSTKIYSKVDDLVLEHVGNQLTRITDSGANGGFYGDEEFFKNRNVSVNSCSYDANGNRLYDSNSNIWGIRYNLLNLPDAMQFYLGHQTNYTYSATGAKLKVIDKTAPPGAELPVTSLNTVLTSPSVSMVTTTDYVGNIIYENGTLKRILTPVGYWQTGTYYYFLKDHLGSNRVVMTGSGGIAETSSYYPSGMRFGESSVIFTNSIQPYRHTGHEIQEMHGLNWIDNLARFRTVSDGSGFTGIDPLCEKYYSISPYAYCANNPINIIDSDGKRLYFVGGANNDRDGWNYINRWGNAFTSSGIRGFTRMNVTRGKSEDIAFTTQYRNSGTETYFKGNVSPSIVAGLSPTSEVGIRPVQNGVINDAVNQIKNNLANNPLKAGEQLNLGGYSYGSVVQAQAALKLANSGTHIDNLILIGSPISTKSDLYKQLSENNNIGNIIRVNIPNDGFSNPEDMKQFLYGVYQSIVSGANAPHFDLARPGATADNAIKAVTDWLKTQGVK